MKKREKTSTGEDGSGTFGPDVSVKGEMLIPFSTGDHFILLCIYKIVFHNTCTMLRSNLASIPDNVSVSRGSSRESLYLFD